jgi:hypothetical protein
MAVVSIRSVGMARHPLADRRTVLGSLGTLAAVGATGLATATDGTRQAALDPLGDVAIQSASEVVAGDDGTTAYVATDAGFVTVDVTDPANPSVLARRENIGVSGIKDVKVDGDRLVVQGPANGSSGGFGLYDVADPANPQQLDFRDTSYGIHNAFLVDGIAYIIDNGAADVVMFDVANDALTEVGRCGLSGARTLHDLWVQDGIGYLNFWNDGTMMVDLSNPADPTEIGLVRDGSSKSPNSDHYVMVDEDASLLAIGKESFGTPLGVELWDVSTKTDTEFLAEIQPPTDGGTRTSHNFDIANGYLYTSWYEGGLRVHDVSDPANPTQVASYQESGVEFWTAKVAVQGESVLGTDYANGALYVFSDPRETDTNLPPSAAIDAPSSLGVGVSGTFDASGASDPDGSVVNYAWDFGDGTTASEASVSHAYGAAGEYTATVTVTDDDGNTDSASTTVAVEADRNEGPNAVIDLSTTTPTVGDAVAFDGSGSSDPDGAIDSYEWAVNGEVVATVESTEYTFSATGDATVTLTVTDGDGATDTASRTVTVEDTGGSCGAETDGGSADGSLYSWWDSEEYTYGTRTADPCEIVVSLDGPSSSDFDLYVTFDGRTPSTRDYDARSISSNSQEQVVLDDVDERTEVGILVDAYRGSGRYTLSVEELGQ